MGVFHSQIRFKHFHRRRSQTRVQRISRNNRQGYPYTGYEYDGQKYHDVTYLGEFEDDELPHNDIELMDILIKRQQKNK